MNTFLLSECPGATLITMLWEQNQHSECRYAGVHCGAMQVHLCVKGQHHQIWSWCPLTHHTPL